MFGKEIRWILLTGNLQKLKLFPVQALLQPKIVTLQVSQLAKTLSG